MNYKSLVWLLSSMSNQPVPNELQFISSSSYSSTVYKINHHGARRLWSDLWPGDLTSLSTLCQYKRDLCQYNQLIIIIILVDLSSISDPARVSASQLSSLCTWSNDDDNSQRRANLSFLPSCVHRRVERHDRKITSIIHRLNLWSIFHVARRI